MMARTGHDPKLIHHVERALPTEAGRLARVDRSQAAARPDLIALPGHYVILRVN
jgi:hypothetical protein